jgi:signal transduction histidine kinase
MSCGSVRCSWPFAASLVLAPMLVSGVWALQAAGLTGSKPSGGEAIQSLVATLTSNWEWLIGTGVSLVLVVLVVLAGLMVFGSQRAPDHLFRVISGVLLILVVIPAVLK